MKKDAGEESKPEGSFRLMVGLCLRGLSQPKQSYDFAWERNKYHLMHPEDTNPSLENNPIKSNVGQTQQRVLFSSKDVPGDTRGAEG